MILNTHLSKWPLKNVTGLKKLQIQNTINIVKEEEMETNCEISHSCFVRNHNQLRKYLNRATTTAKPGRSED